MCFKIERGYNKQYADRDISCYKLMLMNIDSDDYVNIVSMYQKFRYKSGVEYKTKFSRDRWFRNQIHKGFHSYTSLDFAKLRRNSNTNICICKCTIPKGTGYYVNPFYHEFVSESIIIDYVIVDNKELEKLVKTSKNLKFI